MNFKIKEVIVIDSKSVYSVPINEKATEDDVLKAYKQESGEDSHTSDCRQYTYRITTHSTMLYSIRKKIELPEGMLGFTLYDIDIADWWARAYPIIEQIVNITGIRVAEIIKWIRSKNTNKKV